jgi:hypothetical protein
MSGSFIGDSLYFGNHWFFQDRHFSLSRNLLAWSIILSLWIGTFPVTINDDMLPASIRTAGEIDIAQIT